jgi:hypothetical protein
LSLVIGLDRLVLGLHGPWKALEASVPAASFLEAGITRDRLAIRRVLSRARGSSVVVIGSSRADAAFGALRSDPRTGLVFTKVAHAAMLPFAVRSIVDEIVACDPKAVVLVLSEFETNQPLHLVPAASSGSFSAIADLVVETGPRFAFAHRQELYRLALVGLLNSYRYRDVLGRAGVDEVRRFPFDARFVKPLPVAGPLADGLSAEPQTPLTDEQLNLVSSQLRSRFGRSLDAEIAQVRSITRGEHATVQRALIRRSVDRLTAAGIAVIVVEAPLHPAAARLYDVSIRDDFLHFARSLAGDARVTFVPLEESGPFTEADFFDVTHLAGAGTDRMTAAIVHAVGRAMGPETVSPAFGPHGPRRETSGSEGGIDPPSNGCPRHLVRPTVRACPTPWSSGTATSSRSPSTARRA